MHTFKEVFRYEDGKLYWLPKKGRDREIKRWNTRHAGTEAGCIKKHGYRSIAGYGLTHRVVWEYHNGAIPEGMSIDHINENKLDNHIENLQLVTQAYNNQRSNFMRGKGYSYQAQQVTRPYCASRTGKLFGTPCGAYMSYVTAYL